MDTSGGTRRYGSTETAWKNASESGPPSRTAERTLLSEEIDLDGGVTTGVEDLAHGVSYIFKIFTLNVEHTWRAWTLVMDIATDGGVG